MGVLVWWARARAWVGRILSQYQLPVDLVVLRHADYRSDESLTEGGIAQVANAALRIRRQYGDQAQFEVRAVGSIPSRPILLTAELLRTHLGPGMPVIQAQMTVGQFMASGRVRRDGTITVIVTTDLGATQVLNRLRRAGACSVVALPAMPEFMQFRAAKRYVAAEEPFLLIPRERENTRHL